MGFCTNCGANLGNGTENYCPNCGAIISGNISVVSDRKVEVQTQTLDVRNANLSVLTNAYQYFQAKGDEYNAYYRLVQTLIPRQQKGSSALLVWGIIVSALSMFVFPLPGTSDPVAVTFLIIGLGMIGGYILKEVLRKKKLRAMIKESAELDSRLFEYYTGFSQRMFIGPEYTAPDLLLCLLQLIRSGRADNIKEAINAFLTDKHYETVESLQLQTLRAVKSVGRAARTSAIFSGLHFFFW